MAPIRIHLPKCFPGLRNRSLSPVILLFRTVLVTWKTAIRTKSYNEVMQTSAVVEESESVVFFLRGFLALQRTWLGNERKRVNESQKR